MSTSPVDPQDIRAAAEVHRELGPEYSDAVVAAFIDRVDRAVEARVEARLAAERQYQPAVRRPRRALLKGAAIGVCASALLAGVGIAHTHGAIAREAQPCFVHAGAAKPSPRQLKLGECPVPGKDFGVVPVPAKPPPAP